MPSLISHTLVGATAAVAFPERRAPGRFWLLSVLCAVLPDADVIGFSLGVRYGDFLGHRGFFHSLFFAALLGFLVATVFFRSEKLLSLRWWRIWAFFTLVASTHGVLDAFTSGGLGIALLSPFDVTRYFFPWTPIVVSPFGVKEFLGPWGMRVMASEFYWIWLPSLVFLAVVRVLRKLPKKPGYGKPRG